MVEREQSERVQHSFSEAACVAHGSYTTFSLLSPSLTFTATVLDEATYLFTLE